MTAGTDAATVRTRIGARTDLAMGENDRDGFSSLYAGGERIGYMRESDDGYEFDPVEMLDGALISLSAETIAHLGERLEVSLELARGILEERYGIHVHWPAEDTRPVTTYPTASAFHDVVTGTMADYGSSSDTAPRQLGSVADYGHLHENDLIWPRHIGPDERAPDLPWSVFMLDMTGDFYAVRADCPETSVAAYLGSISRESLMRQEAASFRVLGDMEFLAYPGAPLSHFTGRLAGL